MALFQSFINSFTGQRDDTEEELQVEEVTQPPWNIGTNIVFGVESYNHDGCQVAFQGDGYFESTVSRPFSNGKTTITLRPRAARDLLELSDIVLYVRDKNKIIVKSWKSKWDLRKFRFVPLLNRCNILILGGVGFGKTSFVNTVFTAFDSRDTPNVSVDVAGGNPSSHVTGQFSIHRIDAYNFSIMDTWGLTPTNYDKGYTATVTDIIEGRLKDGFSMRDVVPRREELAAVDERKIHVVLFCVDITVLHIAAQKPEILTQTKRKVEEAISARVGVIILITRADVIYKDFSDRLRKKGFVAWMQDLPEVNAAHETFGIKKNQICLTKSYTNEHRRDIHIEKLVMHIFDMCQAMGTSATVTRV